MNDDFHFVAVARCLPSLVVLTRVSSIRKFWARKLRTTIDWASVVRHA